MPDHPKHLPVQRSPAVKLCFVIQKLSGLTGGAERVVIDVARAMSARGFEVSIVTFESRKSAPGYNVGQIKVSNLFPLARAPSPRSSPTSRLEALVKRLPNVLPLTWLKWRLTHGAFERALRRMIRSDAPDVMIAFLPPAITAAAYAAEGSSTRVIGSTHNVPDRDFGDSNRWDQNPYSRQRTRDALKRLDRIFVLLPEFRDWFAKDLHARIRVMPNAIGKLNDTGVADASRSKTVLGVGRLTTIKRFDLLIKAFAQIAADFPDWSVRIFGEGPEAVPLQALIAELNVGSQVSLAGVTQNIGPEYDRAAVLCHPSEFEGFGLAVAEAMAHGTPAIGFEDCPGVNSLVQDGKNGLLIAVTPDPVGALASALRTLLSNKALRQRLGAAATEISKTYAPDLLYAEWEREILKLGAAPRFSQTDTLR